jgi:hypothetical protein
LPIFDGVANVNRTIIWFAFKTLLELKVVAADASSSGFAKSSFWLNANARAMAEAGFSEPLE